MPTIITLTRPTDASDHAVAAAVKALGWQPKSPLWWVWPANRRHAAIAIAERVEARVREQLAADDIDPDLSNLPPFGFVRACPKCQRDYEDASPTVTYVPARTIGAVTYREHMLCTCPCGRTWRELCADGLESEYRVVARSVVDEAIAATAAAATHPPTGPRHRSPFAAFDDDQTPEAPIEPQDCPGHYFPVAAEHQLGFAPCTTCGLPYATYVVSVQPQGVQVERGQEPTHWQPPAADPAYTTWFRDAPEHPAQAPTTQDGAHQ